MATSENIHEISSTGAFVRQKNRFDTPFGNQEGELPVEAGRYRILWAKICPWAHRAIIARELLGLKNVFSVGTASPIRTEKGWDFSLNEEGVDPVLKIGYLTEIYAETDPKYMGRATVPTVVDIIERKVVNNDYFHLTNYLETAFQPFHKKGAPDLYPEALREEIDAFNDVLFHEVNNGVYKAGFAHSQKVYEEAYDILFNRLDSLEKRLANQRYLFGNQLTDADIRFYVTLVRFDVAYYSVFRTNRNRIIDFPNIWNYAKDLYQTKGFGDTTDFESIKKGYQLGDPSTNPLQILAKGPDVSIWNEPHDRGRFS
ncbi:glutathione S-transferase family protein [Enterococcus olivae]